MSTPLNANDIDMIVENDERLQYGRRRDGMVVETSGVLTWEPITDICPIPKYVLDGIVYGSLTGILGAINTANGDIANQIATNIESEVKNLYPTLKDLQYMEDIGQNNFRGNKNRCGVRPLSLISTGEVIGAETLDRVFEIILTTDYINKGATDQAQRLAKADLLTKMELIRRKIRSTKAGSYINVRDVRDYSEPEVEYLEEDGVAIIRGNIAVNYKIKN